MAIREEGDHSIGDSQADIRPVVMEYSEANGYLIHHFADAVCKCGCRVFSLYMDENEGVANRVCTNCGNKHYIGDSEEFAEDADEEGMVCHCEGDTFEITVGVSLYEDSEDVRWLYVGCRCPACGITGCYGDWKNEFNGYQDLLKRV